MIYKQNVRDSRKGHEAHKKHFDLEVTVTPESDEDSDEQTQCANDFAVRSIYIKLTRGQFQ